MTSQWAIIVILVSKSAWQAERLQGSAASGEHAAWTYVRHHLQAGKNGGNNDLLGSSRSGFFHVSRIKEFLFFINAGCRHQIVHWPM